MSASRPPVTTQEKGWRLSVTVLPSRYAVCKLDPYAPAPEWGLRGPFGCVTRTESELCVICPERDVPQTVERSGGWRALRIAGRIDHSKEAGVLLSAAGVYLLNVSHARLSPWAPLTVLFTDRGLRYTLLSALFFAPSVLTIKQAILLSDPYTGTFGSYLAACLWVTPLVLVTSRPQFAQVPRHWKEFAGLGLFAALTMTYPCRMKRSIRGIRNRLGSLDGQVRR